jgi:hypothetical protein
MAPVFNKEIGRNHLGKHLVFHDAIKNNLDLPNVNKSIF